MNTADYVLKPFTAAEAKDLPFLIDNSVDAVASAYHRRAGGGAAALSQRILNMRRARTLDKPHNLAPLHLPGAPSSKHDAPLRP